MSLLRVTCSFKCTLFASAGIKAKEDNNDLVLRWMNNFSICLDTKFLSEEIINIIMFRVGP